MKNIVEAKKNKPDISLWDILDKEARKESRQKVITSALSFIKPLSSMRVTDWVENNRVLPDGSSEPGKFKLSRTPYVKEILECMSPHSPVRDVIWIKSAQIGGSEALYNSIGFLIDQCPATMLLVLPTDRLAKESSRGRIAPLIANTKCLRDKISDSSSKDGGNSIARKEFAGGTLICMTANSAPNLRLVASKYLFLDEVDGFPDTLPGEGAPLDLLLKRTNTFSGERKVMMTSTPLIEDSSIIAREYEKSDQRKFFVPCLHCGELHTLEWQNVVWEIGKPHTARFKCPNCKKEYGEECKTEMMALGKWIPTNELWEDDTRRGYHINALFSPVGWYSLTQAVTEYENCLADESKKQVWQNTVLGLPYAYAHYRPSLNIDTAELVSYGIKGVHLPNDVLCMTVGMDTQGHRVEGYVWGWGLQEKPFLIDHFVIKGDTKKADFWQKVEELITSLNYKRADGRIMAPSSFAIDSGGTSTVEVYKWWLGATLRGKVRRLLCCKGVPGYDKPLIKLSSRKHTRKGLSGAIDLHNIGADSGKSNIYEMIEKREVVFPVSWANGDYLDKEFFLQLTAECQEKRFTNGQAQHRWIKKRERNESLDCAVLALAAMKKLNVDWKTLNEKVGAATVTTLEVKSTAKVSGGDFDNADEVDAVKPKKQTIRVIRGGETNNYRIR